MSANPTEPEQDRPETHLMVCGRTLARPESYHHKAEYQGRTIYFCTEFCLETFLADPKPFYTAHSRSRPPDVDEF